MLCSAVGKRQRRPSVASSAAGINQLFYIDDTSSKRRFLVDTGAQVSVLPASPHERQGIPSSSLVAANKSLIKTFGTRRLTFSLGKESYVWVFVIAEVARPLLGADFLYHTGLLVDVRGRRLINSETLSSVRLRPCSLAVRANHVSLDAIASAEDKFGRLLAEFPAITTPNFSCPTVEHGVQHFIPTNCAPIRSKARRMHPDKLTLAKSHFQTMLELGICRRSNSPWASPLHMADKPGGGHRPCGDFRRLNDITTADQYPVPHIQDFSAHLHGCKVFSKVDLIRGYHQVPMHPDDIAKTAVITPFGLFEFLRMPFGLKGAAQTFQRLMDTVLADLPFLFVYLDDVLVASKNMTEHMEHLRTLFSRLAKHGLIINLKKCVFGKSSIDFLGHHIDDRGIVPLPAKVQAIRDFPRPSLLKDLQRFTGMVNFYLWFIRHCAGLMRPLSQVVAGKPKPANFTWTDDMEQSFVATKKALAEETMPFHAQWDAPLAIHSRT